jgi:hypothetical protein
VAEVRKCAAQQLGQILQRMKQLNVSWREEFMEELNDCECVNLYARSQCPAAESFLVAGT